MRLIDFGWAPRHATAYQKEHELISLTDKLRKEIHRHKEEVPADTRKELERVCEQANNWIKDDTKRYLKIKAWFLAELEQFKTLFPKWDMGDSFTGISES